MAPNGHDSHGRRFPKHPANDQGRPRAGRSQRDRGWRRRAGARQGPGRQARPRHHRPQYARHERVGADPGAPQASERGRHAHRVPDHRIQRCGEAGSQERGRHRLDHQAVQARAVARRRRQAGARMSAIDPTEVFRQEASELFEVLEGALLDLGQRPGDRELVDSAFRALHTIKGSGAMFGFDKVASFTHEFETAFDRVRKGEIEPTQELISVALAAKDYIRALIEDPQSTDDVIGEAILDELKRLVFSDQPAAAPIAGITEALPPAPGESKQAGWHLYLEFESHILRNGSNPLDLLEDLCKLGPCFVVPVTDGIPFLDDMEPEDCYLKWDVKLHAACDKDAIDDVFMFVSDEMKLTLSPLEQVEAPALLPLFQLLDEEPAPVVEMPAPVVQVAPAPVAAQPVAKAEPKAESKPEPKPEGK